MSDLVYVSAGVGLFLQYLADELDVPGADSLAILAAVLLDLVDKLWEEIL